MTQAWEDISCAKPICASAEYDIDKQHETFAINDDKYELSFYDNFDTFDESKWSICADQQRGSVGGRWIDSLVEVKDGKLVFIADVDENGLPVSSGVRTKYKFEQCEGYFEAKCKLQNAEGFWSAFWLMYDYNTNTKDGTESGAEIDIFEAFNIKKVTLIMLYIG